MANYWEPLARAQPRLTIALSGMAGKDRHRHGLPPCKRQLLLEVHLCAPFQVKSACTWVPTPQPPAADQAGSPDR